MEHVGPAHKGSKPAIAQGPVTAEHLGRRQAATDAVSRGLRQAGGGAGAAAVQVCTGDANLCGCASPIAERGDMVEDPVEAATDLVDHAVGKNVSFRQRYIAPMICNVLGTGKVAGLGKPRRTAGNEVGGLIVTEAGECRVLAGESVIQSDIECTFVKLPNRHVAVIDAQCWVARIAGGIKVDHRLARRVEQCLRNNVAVDARHLASVRIDGIGIT